MRRLPVASAAQLRNGQAAGEAGADKLTLPDILRVLEESKAEPIES